MGSDERMGIYLDIMMARYRGLKHKLSLREGVHITGITGTTSPSLAEKLSIPPGQGGRGLRHVSDYGVGSRGGDAG
jgi:hypothetical protein